MYGAPVLQRAHVEDTRDVLVRRADRGGARLAEEAGAGVGVRGGLGKEELDGDAALQDVIRGRHDDAHAPRAEDALDAVLAREDVAGNRDAGGDGGLLRHGGKRA